MSHAGCDSRNRSRASRRATSFARPMVMSTPSRWELSQHRPASRISRWGVPLSRVRRDSHDRARHRGNPRAAVLRQPERGEKGVSPRHCVRLRQTVR
jgi:hypothetical protein